MKRLVALLGLVAGLCSLAPANAAPPEGPASTISIYAGGAFMREYYDGCGDYYGGGYDCGGFDHHSDTYDGPEFGADARFVLPSGLLFDLSVEHARVSDDGDAFLEQQATAGLGFEGHIGRAASWYVEGFYEYYRLGESYDGCSYSCNGWYRANGGGVKGGFTWPFAERFYGTLNLRASYLSGKDTGIDLWEAKLDGAVGYMVTSNLSVAIGASTQAIQQNHDRHDRNYYDYGYYDHDDDTLNHSAVFLRLAFHF